MRKLLISILAMLFFPVHVLSYERNVHWEISDNAINASIIRSYLTDNLNIWFISKLVAKSKGIFND